MMDLGGRLETIRAYYLALWEEINPRYGKEQTLVMAQHYTQVEVLLMTGSTFLAGNRVPKDNDPGDRGLSDLEKLQEACWNGLLETMLPEVWIKPANDGILYLWGIKEAQAFLELELSEVPLPFDKRLSITPHSFLAFQEYN